MDEQSSLLGDFQTRMVVLDAVGELMQHQPFDKITVTQICAQAGVSRATFYRHFRDKFAVPQWYLDYAHSRGTEQIGRTLSWREGYYLTETLVAEKLEFFVNVAKSDDYNAVDNYAPRMRRKALITTLTEYRQVALTERLKFQIDATVEMEVHLLPKWHYGGYDVPLDELCSWIADAIPRELFELLNTPLRPRIPRPDHHANYQG